MLFLFRTQYLSHLSLKTISIIGAGIGGLTTALVLKQYGLNVKVYEAAPEIKPVGAGIMMANNAMQVFLKMGLARKIEDAGNYVSQMNISDERLNPISLVDLTPFESTFKVRNIAIHRAKLQHILAEELGYDNIILGKRLQGIEKGEPFVLHFEDGSSTESDIIIGADGIKSIVREELVTKGELRDSGQVCWRGLCDFILPEKYCHAGVETWGRGKRFGFTKIGSKRVYWYAVVSKHLARNSLSEMFNDFDPLLREIIDSTPSNHIIENEIIDLKPIKQWHAANVCLIGDAAHATTPNMGQGACQAVEDAYIIDKLLNNGIADFTKLFKNYNQIRLKKAHKIVNNSRMIGQISHWENPILIQLRNGAMRLAKGANRTQFRRLFTID